MTSAAQRAASEIGAAAIICLSRSGFTVRSIARFRPRAKILGFSTNDRTVSQLTMSWGTTPVPPRGRQRLPRRSWPQHAARAGRWPIGEVHPGDLVVVLAGSGIYRGRVTDTVRIVHIP